MIVDGLQKLKPVREKNGGGGNWHYIIKSIGFCSVIV